MDGFKLLIETDSVQAPPGFERSVMAELARRKRRRTRNRRLSFAFGGVGVPAAALALLLVTGVLGPEPARRESIRAADPASFNLPGVRAGSAATIPITEALSYSQEIRNRRRQSRTIYILEQVSDRTDTEIMY